jgi:hypothetical protein
MKKIALFLILNCSISSIARSEESIILEKGKPAPYTGFLVPRERVLELRKTELDNQEYKLLNESLTRTVNIYKSNESLSEKQVNILLERNDKLSQELNKSRSMSNFERGLWFFGGMVVTGAAAYTASKLIR